MMNIADTIRNYDFKGYYYLYRLGLSPWQSYFFYFFARYGIVIFFLTFIYLIWKKKIKAFLCTLLAMGAAGLCDLLVFIFWRRPLPYISHADLVAPRIAGMYTNASSFPSSHTYIAFAVATSIFLYGHKRLGSFLFLIAIFVGLGRVGEGLNYPSDVLAGALIGMAAGAGVYFLFRNWEKKRVVK